MQNKRLLKYLSLALCASFFIAFISMTFQSQKGLLDAPSADTTDIADATDPVAVLMADATVDDVVAMYPTTASGVKTVNVATNLPADIVAPQFTIQSDPFIYDGIFVDAPTIDGNGLVAFELTTSLFTVDVQSLVTVTSSNYNDISYQLIVSISDQLPPNVISPIAQRTGASTASLQLTLEEEATVSYVVRPLGTQTPTVEEIAADPTTIQANCVLAVNDIVDIPVPSEPCSIHFFVVARGITTSVYSLNVQGYTVTLEAPSDLRWSTDSTAFAYWLAPANVGAAVVSYEVNLYHNGVLVQTQTVNDTAVDLSSYIGKTSGDYTFTVTAKTATEGFLDSPVSPMSAPFRVLAAPDAPVWNGSELSWTAIPAADSYLVELFYNNGSVSIHFVEVPNTTSYDFGAYFASISADGNFTATVTANAIECGSSMPSPPTVVPYYNDGIAPVIDVTKIVRAQQTMALVRITSSEDGTIYYTTTQPADPAPTTPPTAWVNYGACVAGDTDMTINTLTAGEKAIYVAVVDGTGNASNVISKTIPAYVSPPLATPSNPRWENNIARWDAVENAVGYHVMVYAARTITPVALQTITDGSVTASRDFTADMTQSDSYTFKVKAIANVDTDSDSAYAISDERSIVAPLERASVSVVAGSYIYNGKPHTPLPASVVVTIDNRELPSTDYSIRALNNIDAGEATIIVTAKPNSGYYGSAEGRFTISPRALQLAAPDLVSHQGVTPARLSDIDAFRNSYRASVASQVTNPAEVDEIVANIPTAVMVYDSASIYSQPTVGSIRPNEVPNYSGHFGITFSKCRIGNYLVSAETLFVVKPFPALDDLNILSDNIIVGGEVARLVAHAATVKQAETMLNAAPTIMQECNPHEKAMVDGALRSDDDVEITTLELALLTLDGDTFSKEPQIPNGGIDIIVPYNVLYGQQSDEFVVLHLLADGTTELFSTQSTPPTAVKTDSGVKLRVKNFSPFMFIGQSDVDDTVSSKPDTSSKPTSSKPSSSKPSSSKPASSKPSSSKPTTSKNNKGDKPLTGATDEPKLPQLPGGSEVPQTSDTTPLGIPATLIIAGAIVLIRRK